MDRVTFKINGVQHSVGCEVSSDMTLLDYIRDEAELRGTKYMCREGGCGACVVATVKRPGFAPMAVNSCLVSVTSCQDWEITTIEKVGNKLDGYNVLQTTLAEHNGTQCGYCTPGWIMAMYSLMKSKEDLTMLEIEQSFGSNVCRCTGYRPILEAFKQFAKDAPSPMIIPDIEDLTICKKTGKHCEKVFGCETDDWCVVSDEDLKQVKYMEIELKDGKKWFRANTIGDIFNILYKEHADAYMLVCGNTAKGAYPIDEYPPLLIDISEVSELKGYEIDQNLVIGANTTISQAMDIFQEMAKQEYFAYLQTFYGHLKQVAHIPVRNLGSIAGNLMIKYQHNEFPSDIFLLLETVDASVTILSFFGTKQILTMQQFLKINMKGKIMLNILLPPLNAKYNIVTYKIMPRAQNAHAIVNAGFLYKLEKTTKRVTETRIVFGGLSPSFVRATATESMLLGKDLFTNKTLHAAIKSLEKELIVEEDPPNPSATYRKQLAINLLYKGLLSLCPSSKINSRYKSGVIRLHDSRPVSDARQIYDTDPALWPLNQPIQKLEALIQCSGEARYTEDLPTIPLEVFAAFVLSTEASGTITSIDPSEALKLPGVLQFYSSKNIPGLNSFTPMDFNLFQANEELLCDSEIKYFYQPVAILVAETRSIAERAVKLVKVMYKEIRKPVIDIIKAKRDSDRNTLLTSNDAKDRGKDVDKVVKGSNTIYGQYHFTMENLVCVTKPIEEGLEVHAATQYMDIVQLMTSRALNIHENKIDVYVRRLGGAYGIKISRMAQVAVACNLVAMKLNRPCRFIQPLIATMRAVGKRLPCSVDFEVAVNSAGVIQYMDYNMYEDNGYIINEKLADLGATMYFNCYDNSRWNYKCYNTVTDTASNTSMRAPGTLENISMTEWIMEQISYELSLDPLEVRLSNLNDSKYKDIREMVETIKTNSQYTERRVATDTFNSENRWKKRGLRFALLRWTPSGVSQYFDVNMSVYHGDGSVAIAHSGVEMGQGINTKAAQICAYLLKIPIDKIQIKGNNTTTNPNGYLTGGSVTSQNIGVGVQRCCEELLKRLEPIRSQLNNPTWVELIQTAYKRSVDLQTHGFIKLSDYQEFDVFGVTLAEVEVDILTGEFEILRVDLLQDVGRSVSPEIDIGQVEGAFMMGVGYWTCEKLVYKDTGEILTDRTWSYYVPQARDIPQDFRVYLRKKSYSNDAMFGAKAVGEPPMCMTVVVPFAIREAIASARLESGIPTTSWFQIDGPYTTESICMATATKAEDFKYF